MVSKAQVAVWGEASRWSEFGVPAYEEDEATRAVRSYT